ncbi:MAG: hypothetical protein NZ927_08025 [Candidatus Calescibacterium sp.]|nr:hypothetical protein [Candidatus Calescibacterium sp.]
MKKIVLAATFVFVTAFLSCAKEEGTSSGSNGGGTVQPKKDFASQKEASERIAGSLNSIVTARIVTARMETGGGGGTMAPRFSYIDERLKYHDIFVSKFHQKIQRFKVKEQQGNGDNYGDEVTIISVDLCQEFIGDNCQEFLPKCASGAARIESCNISSSGDKRSVVAVISADSCKDIPDESKGNNYFIYNGKAQIFAECSLGASVLKMGSKYENFKIDYYEAGRKVYEFEFSPSISYVSEIGTDIGQESMTLSASISINGNSREKDLVKNIEQRSSFSGLKLSAESTSNIGQNMTNSNDVTDFISGITDIVIDISFYVSGKYSITTSPQWCGDGEYQIKTDQPIKIKGGEECPYSGKLTVNNSSVQFTGSNKVKIAVGNESKEYSCQELYALCPYPLRGPTYLFSDMGGEPQ